MRCRNCLCGLIIILSVISEIVCRKKSSKNVIQEVDRKQLEKLIISEEYLAVFFYKKTCQDCDDILEELERIDDEAEDAGITFVKNIEKSTAKHYGVISFPSLVYFRNEQPATYEGDLRDEEKVLEWLTDLDSLELVDQIEDVNDKMLGRLIEEKDYLAVLLYKENDTDSDNVLQELEKIDEKADALGIDFVKIADENLAMEYDLDSLPTLIYYRNGIPLLFQGDLDNEEEVLKYLVEFQDTEDETEEDVESSSEKNIILKLIEESPYFSLLFYDDEDEAEDLLKELDEIDVNSTLDRITFTKHNGNKLAQEYKVSDRPALIFFDNQSPNLYKGNISNAKEVFKWLIEQTTSDDREESDDTDDDDIDDDDDEDEDETDDARKNTRVPDTSAKPLANAKISTSLEQQAPEDTIDYVNKDTLEKIIKEIPYAAVLFYKDRCRACKKAAREVEKVKDEIEEYGIEVYRINDREVSHRYGIKTLPAMAYFRNGNPMMFDGDLRNESFLLEWLTDDDNWELPFEIETITLKMLNKLVAETLYLSVYFYSPDCEECKRVLKDLETVDDECLASGRSLVKISDPAAQAQYMVEEVPALAIFKSKEIFWYEGDFYNDGELLDFLTSDDAGETEERIEEVNQRMLKKLLDDNQFVAVFFYEDNCVECDRVLEELEHIDDELDDVDILLLKIRDLHYAKKLGIIRFPTLIYFRSKVPTVYKGDLLDEEKVLEMLIKHCSIPSEIDMIDVCLFIAITVSFVFYTILWIYCEHKNKVKE